jgi:hypothetical protein
MRHLVTVRIEAVPRVPHRLPFRLAKEIMTVIAQSNRRIDQSKRAEYDAAMKHLITTDEYQEARARMLASSGDRYAALIRYVKGRFNKSGEIYEPYPTVMDAVETFWAAFCRFDPVIRRNR